MQGAGVSIGVSTHIDGRLTSCPAAARTAEALAAGLGAILTGGATAVTDPKGSYELFLAIQGAIQKARGGTFFMYFAGLTIRRGDDLLLTTGGSSLDGKTDCVPWSDVDAILAQERITSGLVILNAEGFAGVGWLGPSDPRIRGIGSVRIHDPLTADRRIHAYGSAVVAALTGPAWDLREHLTDGRLDLAALDRYLATRFPAPPRDGPPPRGEEPRHETFGEPESIALELRDLRAELAAGPPAKATARGEARGGAVSEIATAGPATRTPMLISIALAVLVVLLVAALLLRG